MGQKLLKECVTLIVETMVDMPQAPFKLIDDEPAAMPKRQSTDYEIEREFPLVISPAMAEFMGISPGELEGDIDMGPHMIGIDVEANYSPPERYRGFSDEPPDPGDFEVVSWNAVTLDGMHLTDEDAKKLQAYLGSELTDKEEDMIMQYEADNPPEPDYDDMYDARRNGDYD